MYPQMYDRENHYSQDEAARLRRLYDQQLKQYDALLYAQHEGVFEVTIRSGSVTETVTLINESDEVSQAVIEALQKRMDRTENALNQCVLNMGENMKHDLNKEKREADQRKADTAAQWAAFQQPVAQSPAPASQAHPQGKASRRAAALPLPMNGSTALAAARATQSTPQA